MIDQNDAARRLITKPDARKVSFERFLLVRCGLFSLRRSKLIGNFDSRLTIGQKAKARFQPRNDRSCRFRYDRGNDTSLFRFFACRRLGGRLLTRLGKGGRYSTATSKSGPIFRATKDVCEFNPRTARNVGASPDAQSFPVFWTNDTRVGQR